MTEQHSNSFEIDASGALQEVIATDNLRFVPHLDSLQALAELVGTRLPENPRVLLLTHNQIPNTDRLAMVGPQGSISHLPQYNPGDIVVSLPATGLVDASITQGVAMALAEQRRRRQTLLLNRVSGAFMLTGAGVSFAGEVATQNRALAVAGFALFALGVAVLAYAHNRAAVELPKDIDWSSPPIALEPLPEQL